ncbi:MAG: hypothetical protein ACR2QF_02185, partial [Geminicoccaceae bacterium]
SLIRSYDGHDQRFARRRDDMDVRSHGRYETQDREIVAEGADLRVQVITLAPGQNVPWHYHSEITDSFVGL